MSVKRLTTRQKSRTLTLLRGSRRAFRDAGQWADADEMTSTIKAIESGRLPI
jgi:hypothetical protein